MDKCDTGEQGAMSACPESSDLSKEIVSRIIHSFESHVDKALAEEASNIPQANTPTLAGCGISGMNMGASAAPVSSPGQSTPPTPPSEPFRFVVNLNLNNWGPIPGVGTSHLGLSCAPSYTQGVRYAAQSPEASRRSLEEARKSRAGKIKISQERRRSRRHGVSDLVSMAKDSYQGKQLRDAVSAEDEEAVERLLTSGVDANSPDSRQRYPLHIAAAKGNHKIARLLLNHGADPNVQDAIGNTPLHLASCTCQVPVITVLLNAGTDLRTLDTFGKTPLQLARGRLLLLKEDMSFSNEQLRSQVMEVVDMIMSYRVRQWHQERFGKDDQLEDLCSQFAQTSTREEVVDGVGNLLAHLDIARDSGASGATGGAANDCSSSSATSTAASATSSK